MTNNYLKILLHLKQFEGDGKFHEIESVLGDIDQKEKRVIIEELAREDLIYLDGGRMTGLPLIGFGDGRGNVKWIGGNDADSKYIPFSGKLKFKGSKYLKEELEMIDKNKYQIKVGDGSTANVIIGSPGATINNKTEIVDKVKTIIKTIENDNSIDASTRQNAIGDFNQLLKEVEQDTKNPATIEKVFSLGGNISSIGSLVVSLIQLLAAH
jgi:hypothetical protein